MSQPCDLRQRKQGIDPSRSFIVQAPAGSGKTELLTQRMLMLLAHVENPEEAVAITFTRKAAAEMAHRLLDRLNTARYNPAGDGLEPYLATSHRLALKVLENDERRGWQLLDQPSRLRIRTIDSLCSDLARQLPILSGLGAGQQIAEDPQPLYLQAATRTMAAIEDASDDRHEDVARILDRYNNQYDRLVELLTGMLGRRDQWQTQLAKLRVGENFDRAALEETLRGLVQRELAAIVAEIPAALWDGLAPTLAYAADNGPADADALSALLGAGAREDGSIHLPASADSLEHWLTLARRLLTADGKNIRKAPDAKAGFPAPSGAKGEERARRQHWKDDFSARLDMLRERDGLCDRLATILSLPRPEYDDEAWASLQSLMHILTRSQQEWLLVMAESGNADFIEIAARALLALGGEGEPSEFALRLDYRIRHLLVDEFQDTSHSQIRLLERLTEGWTAGDGRTLFLVGDPMQSIYRFRKAEVSLFIKIFESRRFGQLALEPLQLSVNFRSTATMVEWVNSVFPRVLPGENDAVKSAVAYSPATARPGAPLSGVVRTSLSCRKDDLAEAERVVDVIRTRDPQEKTAILVRSRKHAAAILARLDELKQHDAHFRYSAVDFYPLTESPLIQDLVSLTLALLQPVDRLAWLSVLRAPFVGLDLADLDALAGGASAPSVPEAIETRFGRLGESGQARLRRVSPALQEAMRLRGRAPIRDVVESAWQQLGGPACVENESELQDAATYFDRLEALERGGQAIDRGSLEKQLENLWAEPDAQAGGRLQVMTIYSAKGLEFDTVILPGLNKGTGSDGARLMHWFELAEQDRIVFSPMRNVEEKETAKREGDLVRFISGVERERQRLENGRLLYVAATRAISDLYLFADVPPDSKGEFKPAPATLLAELWPALPAEAPDQLERQLADLEETPGDQSPWVITQRYRRLDMDWAPPAPAEPLPMEQPELPEPPDYIPFRWAGEDARLAGDLVHRILQLIAEAGSAAWRQEGGFTKNERWCRQQLQSGGIRGPRADRILQRIERAVNMALESKTGRWLLADHPEADCEYALTAVFEGRPVNLVLDRTFVHGGERWIIDYKTSDHEGGSLDDFLESEADRYREQLERYRRAMALSEKRPIRTALYFPLLDHFLEI